MNTLVGQPRVTPSPKFSVGQEVWQIHRWGNEIYSLNRKTIRAINLTTKCDGRDLRCDLTYCFQYSDDHIEEEDIAADLAEVQRLLAAETHTNTGETP